MKKLLIVVGALVALLLVAWFVVTSSGFLKSVVLPRVGTALNARVEAGDIALSPLSSVEIRNLTVTPNGADRLLAVEVARVRYSLFAILGGRMVVDEIHLSGPSVTLVRKADGTSNLDPILKKLAEGATPAPSTPAGPGKPIELDLKSLRIENGIVSYQSAAADGGQLAGELSGLNLSVLGLKNGGKARIEVVSGLKFEQRGGGANPTNGSLLGSLNGGFDLALSPELVPGAMTGGLDAALLQATGTYAEFRGFGTALAVDLVPGDLRNLAVEFSRQGAELGALTVKGPLDFAKMEAKLQVDLSAIDRNVLNLAGAGMGLDFTTTRFDSTNQVEVTGGGQRVAINGSLTGTRVSVTKGDLILPAVDLKKTYDLAVDVAGQSATVKSFALSGTQAGREILSGTLSQPLQLSWAPNAGVLPDAALQFVVSDLRLADWSALAGAPLQGTFQARADVGVKGGGKDIGFDLTAALAGFSGTFASNEVKNLGFTAAVKGGVAGFAEASRRRLTMTADVKDLGGTASLMTFDRYQAAARMDLGLPENEVIIHDIQVQLRQQAQEGGTIGVKGRWNMARGAGDLTVTARDVNENGLRPFLQAALGDKQLKSVKVVADLTAKIDPAADMAIKATADVKDLVVRDPSGVVPESPLAAGVAVDFSGSGQKLTVRQGEIRLTPTARAKNMANLTGDLDLSKTNAVRGAFKLAAESIDITAYYDLFTGGTKPADAGTPVPAPTEPVPPAGPSTEPEAVLLPIELLTLEATVGKFYLREVAAENFMLGLKIVGSRIEVQPLQLALNGAPIRGGMKLNLGVPGFEYDVNLSADRIPVKPLANSFAPSLKDRIEGAMVAGLEVKGAGVTGVNLQKHLTGGLSFSVTNANLKITDDGRKKGILSMLVSLLATSLNIRELKDQPIMDILAIAKLGGGKIELTEARARSASLEVGTLGTIPIAAELMASPLNFPVNVALNRELAQRARMIGSDTPTNQLYVPIPAIASLKGTLGAPSPEVDKVKAGLLAARGVAGLLGGRAGDTVGGVADLVGGVARGGTNAVGNLIQGIGGLLGGARNAGTGAAGATPPPAASTNAAPTNTSTNTNAAPANPLGGLLRGLMDRDRKKP